MFKLDITYTTNTKAYRTQPCIVDTVTEAEYYVILVIEREKHISGVVLVYLYDVNYAAMLGDVVIALVEINDYATVGK